MQRNNIRFLSGTATHAHIFHYMCILHIYMHMYIPVHTYAESHTQATWEEVCGLDMRLITHTHTHTLDTMHPCYNNQTHYLLYLLYLMSLTPSHPSHPHTSPPPPVHRRNTYCVKRRTNEIQGTLSTAATVAHITRKW